MKTMRMASCEAVHPLTDEEIASRMLLLESGNRGSYVHKAINTLDVCGLTPAQIEELHPGQTSPSHELPDARGATPGARAFIARVCPPGTDTHSYHQELRQFGGSILMSESGGPAEEIKIQTKGPSPVEAGKELVVTYVIKLDLEAKAFRTSFVMMTTANEGVQFHHSARRLQ